MIKNKRSRMCNPSKGVCGHGNKGTIAPNPQGRAEDSGRTARILSLRRPHSAETLILSHCSSAGYNARGFTNCLSRRDPLDEKSPLFYVSYKLHRIDSQRTSKLF